jgi:GH15 family glucan-1,4-alpha-glucosidase
MIRARRTNGYAPIEAYGILGDGRTVALVALDGRIDWWPFPALDSPPVTAALLDPDRGGHFTLAPDGEVVSTRRYLEDTNVLETIHTTPTGQVCVTEALNTGAAGRLPWTELARRVEGRHGTVRMRWEFIPGDCFGQASPWVTERDGTPVITLGDQSMAVIVDGDGDDIGPMAIGPHQVSGTISVRPGQHALLAVTATDSEPLFIPRACDIEERLYGTATSWGRWTSQIRSDGPWDPFVRRSALALKTLLAEDTGAIAAAATTSLPEGLGGEKNWDYRFAWVRDSSFTVDALINLGLHEEVHAAVSWLLDAIRRSDGDVHVFYSLDGTIADKQVELDIPGYRQSRPVRSGNSASGQTQLGTYGDLFDTIDRYCKEGHHLDPATGRLLSELADRCSDRWRQPDSGIWELHDLEHYTISKIGCWVALDRAVQLAEAAQIPDDHVDRWRSEAGEIRDWVNRHCWSDAKSTYTLHPDTGDLDAAVLLAGRTGFERGGRLAATIDAVSSELGQGPLLYRYTGMEHEEGAFVACTFWMVEALAHTGQVDRASQLMDQAVRLTNDLGLLSEQIDPKSGAFLGNLPQGLSHLALINAAFALQRARP